MEIIEYSGLSWVVCLGCISGNSCATQRRFQTFISLYFALFIFPSLIFNLKSFAAWFLLDIRFGILQKDHSQFVMSSQAAQFIFISIVLYAIQMSSKISLVWPKPLLTDNYLFLPLQCGALIIERIITSEFTHHCIRMRRNCTSFTCSCAS